MTAVLQTAVWLGTRLVLGPAWKPPTAAIANEVLRYGNVFDISGPPLIIKDLCQQQEYLQRLLTLDFVQWAVQPLLLQNADHTLFAYATIQPTGHIIGSRKAKASNS
ncbi:hypothetical protein EPUS_07329 [Endocarpon pusillum Z07020]|uniref:Uncharacterized protein n=1 Tax=Endocarpon pusillum (strain Z07020 / HMAS-L-300199) TaxID=1263415 RepID=U1I358_ENDPU|nr:uncharacterized protein EPUS_07329 [Endocarpon pusillum Z07020]ERF76449.1 hypothetical protein EPUS_07329 [Endocarpon pusillum Z07020]